MQRKSLLLPYVKQTPSLQRRIPLQGETQIFHPNANKGVHLIEIQLFSISIQVSNMFSKMYNKMKN
jgi:hypothetical protein